MQSPVINIVDIETASLTVSTWGLFDQTIGLNQIQEDWRILSFAAKQYKVKGVQYYEARLPFDEKALLEKLWKVLDESDFIVAHNGKKFDIRKINARLIQHGFKPYSPVVVVDTLLESRKVASFTSHKLEYLTGILCKARKRLHKRYPGFALWKACLEGDPKAWDEMRRYNVQDVVSLEELYTVLLPWMPTHPNVGPYTENHKPTCPRCGSTKLYRRGTYKTGVGTYQRYSCRDCGGWSRGRSMLFNKAERAHITSGV